MRVDFGPEDVEVDAGVGHHLGGHVESTVFGPVVTVRGVVPDDQSNRVEVRLEARPRVAANDGGDPARLGPGFGDLATIGADQGLGGCTVIGTATGSVNNSLDAISVLPDGRVFRLVIREIENLLPRLPRPRRGPRTTRLRVSCGYAPSSPMSSR